MMRGRFRTITLRNFAAFVVLGFVWLAQSKAQNAPPPYPSMAPLEQYQMERSAEIALAKSAAPESVSGDADVMVLGRHGYETAVKGKNGFVCMVQRSWAAGIDDPEFWNPKLRAPICFNAPAARFNVPLLSKKTELVLAGRSKAQMAEEIKAALDKREVPPLEAGAMCYMLSKQGYLNDHDGHWHPHLMFFVPPTDPLSWGAGLPGSQIIGVENLKKGLHLVSGSSPKVVRRHARVHGWALMQNGCHYVSRAIGIAPQCRRQGECCSGVEQCVGYVI